MMSESIIVGVVVGVVVAGIGAVTSHYLRKREMEALWAQEERRRKSDRRRELYERDLRIVSNFMDAVVGAMAEVRRSAWVSEQPGWEFRFELLANPYPLGERARAVTGSFNDQELTERVEELCSVFAKWARSIDLNTGKAMEGKEEECEESRGQTQLAASEVWRRIREILEEV